MSVSRELLLAAELKKLNDQTDIATTLSVLGYLCGQTAEVIAPTDAAKAKLWMKISVGLDKLSRIAEEAHL